LESDPGLDSANEGAERSSCADISTAEEYNRDGTQEPSHVLVEKVAGEAKLWLRPIQLAYSYRLNPSELRRVRELTFEHQAMFMERWNEHLA
jgi:hypothetical protein